MPCIDMPQPAKKRMVWAILEEKCPMRATEVDLFTSLPEKETF